MYSLNSKPASVAVLPWLRKHTYTYKYTQGTTHTLTTITIHYIKYNTIIQNIQK